MREGIEWSSVLHIKESQFCPEQKKRNDCLFSKDFFSKGDFLFKLLHTKDNFLLKFIQANVSSFETKTSNL